MKTFLPAYEIPVAYQCPCGYQTRTITTAYHGGFGTNVDCPKCGSTGIDVFDDTNPAYRREEPIAQKIYSKICAERQRLLAKS